MATPNHPESLPEGAAGTLSALARGARWRAVLRRFASDELSQSGLSEAPKAAKAGGWRVSLQVLRRIQADPIAPGSSDVRKCSFYFSVSLQDKQTQELESNLQKQHAGVQAQQGASFFEGRLFFRLVYKQKPEHQIHTGDGFIDTQKG